MKKYAREVNILVLSVRYSFNCIEYYYINRLLLIIWIGNIQDGNHLNFLNIFSYFLYIHFQIYIKLTYFHWYMKKYLNDCLSIHLSSKL